MNIGPSGFYFNGLPVSVFQFRPSDYASIFNGPIPNFLRTLLKWSFDVDNCCQPKQEKNNENIFNFKEIASIGLGFLEKKF